MPSGPLVILTQSEPDNQRLAGLLRDRGIKSVSYPCIQISYLEIDPAADVSGRPLEDYEVVVFTSRRGVMGAIPLAARLQAAMPVVACVGEATADEVSQSLGMNCAILPPTAKTGEALAAVINERFNDPVPLLHIRGNQTTGTLKTALEADNWRVAELVVYSNTTPDLQPIGAGSTALAMFASPSAVKAFFTANQELARRLHCVAIGPSTAACLHTRGAARVTEADQPDPETVANTIERIAREASTNGV